MTEEGKEWMIAQAYCGLITFIINIVLLYFFIGYIKTSAHKHTAIINFALLVVISSLIYCFSSSIIMSDAIFGIRLTDEICVFAFRWVYAWWTVQRYFVYLFFIYRLSSIFKGTPFAISAKCINIFVIIVTIAMIGVLFSWILLYPTKASYDDGYSECTTSLDGNGYQILVISAIILIDIIIAISTMLYFVRRLFALAPGILYIFFVNRDRTNKNNMQNLKMFGAIIVLFVDVASIKPRMTK